MSAIGDQTFITLQGEVTPVLETIEDVTRPNVDGVAYRKMGKRGKPFTFTGVRDVADTTAVATLVTAYKALVGTLQTVVDDRGTSYTNVLVQDVIWDTVQGIRGSVGGIVGESANFLMTSHWTLILTGTS